MQRRVILIDPQDNVVTALADLDAGEVIEVKQNCESLSVRVTEEIPFGHKVAVEPICAGGEIIKYGQPIARATQHICAGEHVHVHNADAQRGRGDLS